MRPIDADALEPKFVHGRWDDTYVSETELMNAPTLDVVERKHGQWIKMSDSDGIYFACSVCGEDLPRVIQRFDPQFDLFPRLESIDKTNYCPNCGADMRGEKK